MDSDVQSVPVDRRGDIKLWIILVISIVILVWFLQWTIKTIFRIGCFCLRKIGILHSKMSLRHYLAYNTSFTRYEVIYVDFRFSGLPAFNRLIHTSYDVIDFRDGIQLSEVGAPLEAKIRQLLTEKDVTIIDVRKCALTFKIDPTIVKQRIKTQKQEIKKSEPITSNEQLHSYCRNIIGKYPYVALCNCQELVHELVSNGPWSSIPFRDQIEQAAEEFPDLIEFCIYLVCCDFEPLFTKTPKKKLTTK